MTWDLMNKEEGERKLSDGEQAVKSNTWKPAGIESNILTVETPPGYVDRWVLDHPPGNIMKRLRQGYEFVIDPTIKVGDEHHIDGHRVPGDVVCKYGNPRQKDLQYLMRITKEKHDELVKKQQLAVDEIDKQLYRKEGGEQYVAPESKQETGLAQHRKD